MATDKRWTLITVTYNSERALEKYWAGQKLPSWVEWIVVDNASTDESVRVARDAGAKVVALPRNTGFGAANNIGFRQSTTPYVGFVNPDVSAEVSTLPVIQEVIERTGGLVAPQLVNPDGSLQPNGRGYPFLVYKVLNRFRNSHLHARYRVYAAESVDQEVVWLMGAVVLGDRRVLEDLGPWDPHFFVYYEDSDLGLRATTRGVPSVLTGRVRWVHGWARETTKLAWVPWKLELISMAKFYARYPRLLSPWPSKTERRLRQLRPDHGLQAHHPKEVRKADG